MHGSNRRLYVSRWAGERAIYLLCTKLTVKHGMENIFKPEGELPYYGIGHRCRVHPDQGEAALFRAMQPHLIRYFVGYDYTSKLCKNFMETMTLMPSSALTPALRYWRQPRHLWRPHFCFFKKQKTWIVCASIERFYVNKDELSPHVTSFNVVTWFI